MKTINVAGYSGEWAAKALAAMKADGEVRLTDRQHTFVLFWDAKSDNETRLVQAAAKLKGQEA